MDELQTLSKLAINFFRTKKINISQSDINLLINKCNGDRGVLQNELDKIIQSLKTERSRLLKVKEEIIDGKITALGFQEALNSVNFSSNFSSSGEGLTISNKDQKILLQIVDLEDELSKAKLMFTPNSCS